MAKYKVNQDGLTATDLSTGKTVNVSSLNNYKVLSSGGTTGATNATQTKPKVPLANKITNFLGGKGITDLIGASTAENYMGLSKEQKKHVEYPTGKEVLGSVAQSAANFIPGAGKGASLLGKAVVGGATGYAFDAGSDLQANKSVGQALTPGVGTALGGALPVAGAVLKPATRIVGRLFKGIGSGLSGVSTETIDQIVNNPRAAELANQRLAKNGNAKFLEENARTVMNGISGIKKNARAAFGKGLEELSEADIKPAVFRQNTQQFLDDIGFSTSQKGKHLANIEFSDPKNVSKAKELINRLNTTKLDGKSLRKLADDVESSAYKIATSDERLSFNAFLKDFKETIKGAVSQSTNKLDDINKQFSDDVQLAEAAEGIFGKVKFKNLPEVVKATKKLEGLFAQKGIAPDVIDKFLTKIGVDPSDFRAGEAVRQISNKSSGANAKGLSFGELTQQLTSSVVTPQMVRNISMKLGIADSVLVPELKKLAPAVRNALMNALVSGKKQEPTTQSRASSGNDLSLGGALPGLGALGESLSQGSTQPYKDFLSKTNDKFKTREGAEEAVMGFGPGVIGSVSRVTPELIAKRVDANDLRIIRGFLGGSLNKNLKAQPMLEAMGLKGMEDSVAKRFLREVIDLSTKRLKIKSN